MQKTVQKIVEAIVGSKPSLLANRPKKTVEKTVQGTVGGNRLENRREETVEKTIRQTVLVVNLETGTVKVKL
jgi:hypothetical protein